MDHRVAMDSADSDVRSDSLMFCVIVIATASLMCKPDDAPQPIMCIDDKGLTCWIVEDPQQADDWLIRHLKELPSG